MKTYNVGGRFTLSVVHANITAKTTEGTEQKLTRAQAARILRKAHTEHKVKKV